MNKREEHRQSTDDKRNPAEPTSLTEINCVILTDQRGPYLVGKIQVVERKKGKENF